jgi:GMP synthase-like glutamine amidotransferase
MNIYEEDKFPWLREEKKFIAQAIADHKILLGICLGSQLIADVLGGKVSKNKFKEIGWFPVSLTREA